jgi:soluble lytic murein transglycosylase-like protein
MQFPKIVLAVVIACAVLAPRASLAELAVFTDGRFLKVEDAHLEGSQIILELPGGGTLTVSALRIDRVIADEIVAETSKDAFRDPICTTSWQEAPLPEGLPFEDKIEAASRASDLHPRLVAAVVQIESDFDPRAVSRAGAAGLMQLMPAAAADHRVANVFDPAENLRGGTAHLRQMLDRFGSLAVALAAYNSGAATVERYGGIPPYRETRDYVRRVFELFCPEG